jgi:hypothetical protein
MAKPSDEILTETYGRPAPDAAKFAVGARDRADIEKATDARRAQSDANKPRQYER